jgi:hypothetical protein
MKRLLFLAFSLASVSAFAQETLSNGWMPTDSPASIEVANVPGGSGVPSGGQSVGYSEATPVSDGLYQVPGFMPYEPSAGTMWPRVIDVKCMSKAGVWYCTGYHIDGVLGRGEDIYVRPEFVKVAHNVTPVAPLFVKPEVVSTPVPHAHRPLVKPKPKKVCN